MKILFVNKFFYVRGGLERVLFNETKILNKYGHEVAIFSTNHPANNKSEYSSFFTTYYELGKDGKDISLIEKVNSFFRIIHNVEAKKRIKVLLDNFKPDIVHIHGIHRQISPSIFEPIKKRRIPIVQTVHDYHHICPNSILLVNGKYLCNPKRCSRINYFPAVLNKCIHNSYINSLAGCIEMTYHQLLRSYKKNIDIFIAPSYFLCDFLLKNGFDESKIMKINNPINLEATKVNVDSDNYLLFAGRLSREKGIFTLLKAIKKIKDIKLIIAGKGKLENYLKDFVRSYNLDVDFIGYVDLEIMKQYLGKSLALILPSEWYENAPISILEAFSSSKPVIASNIGGISEMVDNLKDGLLFEPGNVIDLVEKIKYILMNPKIAFEMGQNGREKVEKNYSIDKHYESLMTLYTGLLK